MSIFKKLFGLILAFVIMLGNLSVFAADDSSSEGYDIVVTKVKMNDLSGWPKSQKEGEDSIDGYTGNKIEKLENYFGEGASTMEGVCFELYKKDESTPIKEALTDANGQILFEGLEKGDYIIKENKSKSKYKNDNKDEIGKSVAVPIEVKLPVYKADGSTYTNGENALHVYPKSTIGKPTIEKFVNDSDLEDTALKGEDKTFTIKSTMPEGIEEYSTLKFIDEMDKGLTYNEGLKVYLGETELGESDYNFTKPGDRKIEISIKEAKIKELKSGDIIKITYKAFLNEDAIKKAKNENRIKVMYGTNSKDLKEDKPSSNPSLRTGAIRFKKIDGLDKKALSGAEFVVKNADEKFLKEENSKLSWVDSEENATRYTSNDDGIFEIKGLPYKEGTKYYLEELKAPKGYAKLSKEYEFEIKENTYYSNFSDLSKINENEVANNKISIPQTGGKGAVKIVAAGLVLTAAGLVFKKKYLSE